MTPEQDNTHPENFRARPFDTAGPSVPEKPWFTVPDVDLDKAIEEGKIQGGDSLLITSFTYTGMGLETYKDTKTGDLREEKLQDLRRRFTEAKTREENPMDSEIANKYLNRLEKKLTEVNPDWKKEEPEDVDIDLEDEDALFQSALAAAEGSATSSQSPIRSSMDDGFNTFLQEVDDKMNQNQAENLQAPLTQMEQTIKASVLKDGQTNTGTWYRNNSDIIVKLVQEGHLPTSVLEEHKSDLQINSQNSPVKPEIKNGSTFGEVKLEYAKLLSEIKKNTTATDQDKQLMERRRIQLQEQMQRFEDLARQKGLFSDIDSKYTLLQADLIAYLDDDGMTSEQRASFEGTVNKWSATDKGSTSPELQGVRSEYAAKLKRELTSQITAAKSSESSFMKQVGNYSETAIPKRVEGIEKRIPEEQRAAFRFFIEEIEKTDKGRFDSTTNNIMTELLKIAERPGINVEVKSEVIARIHLHSCATSLRRVVTSETDRVGGEFLRAANEIGDYSLTGSDLETLLQKGLPGLEIEDSFQVLQAAAYRGEFSGKIDEIEGKRKREMLVGEILRKHADKPSFDREAAEKSYDLAMKVAEATFELSVWDTSGGDYLSQAIYFSKWRAKDGIKGPPITVDKIHSIGTSFLRNATAATEKYRDKSVKIINKDDWNKVVDLGKSLVTEYRNVPVTEQNFKQGRYQSLVLHRIQTEADCVILADQYYPDKSEVAQRNRFLQQELSETSPNLQERPKGMLSFDESEVRFGSMSKNAYREYLTNTLPSILKAKELLTKVNITSAELEKDNSYQEWAETLDRVDPNGVMSLRFWFIVGAMSTALNSRMELSEVSRVARRLHKDKMSGKGVFNYLPKYLPDGRPVEKAANDYLSSFWKGLGNAMINVTERRVGIKT